MSAAHLYGPVAGRHRLARVDWRGEGALQGDRKASQRFFRLCCAAGRKSCTSRCSALLAHFMGGRKTSERGLRGCAHFRRGAGRKPVEGLLARRILEEGPSVTVPPLTTFFGLPSVLWRKW